MKKKSKRISKLFLKKGDTVKILSGNAKGKTSEILQLFPSIYRALVRGVNIVARHRKPSAKHPQGGIEKKEAPIHISNLMLVDPVTGQATRVGRKRNAAGKLERYAKKTGNIIQ